MGLWKMKKLKLGVGLVLGLLEAAFLQDPRLIALLVAPVLIMVTSFSFEVLIFFCVLKVFFCNFGKLFSYCICLCVKELKLNL